MTENLSYDESVPETSIPHAWDAKLILGFLHTPGFETFDGWIDDALTELEGQHPHVRSFNARQTWHKPAQVHG